MGDQRLRRQAARSLNDALAGVKVAMSGVMSRLDRVGSVPSTGEHVDLVVTEDERAILDSVRRLLQEDTRAQADRASDTTARHDPIHPDEGSGSMTPATVEPGHADPAKLVDDVFELSPTMMVPAPEAAGSHGPDGAAEPAVAPPAEGEGADARTRSRETLIGPDAASATQSALGSLRDALRGQSVATHRGGPTLEEILRDEMRPMIREWLDRHLPQIVERAVRTEIQRLANRDEI